MFNLNLARTLALSILLFVAHTSDLAHHSSPSVSADNGNSPLSQQLIATTTDSDIVAPCHDRLLSHAYPDLLFPFLHDQSPLCQLCAIFLLFLTLFLSLLPFLDMDDIDPCRLFLGLAFLSAYLLLLAKCYLVFLNLLLLLLV